MSAQRTERVPLYGYGETVFPVIQEDLVETVTGEIISTRPWKNTSGYKGKWVQIETPSGMGIFGLPEKFIAEAEIPPMGSVVEIVLKHGRSRAFAQNPLELKSYSKEYVDPPLPPVTGPSLETYTVENIRRWRRTEDKLTGCLILLLREHSERQSRGFQADEVERVFKATYGFSLAEGTVGMLLRKMAHDYEYVYRQRTGGKKERIRVPKKPMVVRPRRGWFLPDRNLVPTYLRVQSRLDEAKRGQP